MPPCNLRTGGCPGGSTRQPDRPFPEKKGGKTILEPSGLGIVVNGKTSPEASRDGMWKKVKDNVCDTFETRGKYPHLPSASNEYVVSGKNSSLRLRARVFNNGVAFRYEWTEEVKKAPSLNISEEKPPSPFRKKPSCGPRTPPPPWAPARGSGLLPE